MEDWLRHWRQGRRGDRRRREGWLIRISNREVGEETSKEAVLCSAPPAVKFSHCPSLRSAGDEMGQPVHELSACHGPHLVGCGM